MSYKVSLKNRRDSAVEVTYDGVILNGVTGFRLETTEEGPVMVMTLKPDLVELDVGFSLPQRSLSL